MKLEKTLSFYHFKDRGGVTLSYGKTVSLSFGTDGCLLLNGTHAYRSEGGVFTLPLSHLCEGENALALEVDGERIPVEGIRRRDRTLFPAGLSKDTCLILLLKETAALAARVRELEDGLSRLTTKNNERTLFH